jgi:preprotein translocase subunit SecG
MTFVVFVAAMVVLAVCALLVLHRDYHAGLSGNAGLGLLALVALSCLTGIIEGEVRITPHAALLWIGLALFLGRHACKFLQRWLHRGPTWYARLSPQPRCARSERHGEDVVRFVP